MCCPGGSMDMVETSRERFSPDTKFVEQLNIARGREREELVKEVVHKVLEKMRATDMDGGDRMMSEKDRDELFMVAYRAGARDTLMVLKEEQENVRIATEARMDVNGANEAYLRSLANGRGGMS